MKKITLEQAKQKFFNQKRIDVKLCENNWNGWTKKSKFYDTIQKECFWSIPSNVYRLKTVHPKRRYEKQKQTTLKKYGVEHSLQSSEIREKIKKTNIKKYGVGCVFQSEEIKNKIKTTNLKKYNVPYANQSEEIKSKIIKTNVEKHGFKNAAQSEKIKNKIIKTNVEKYGVCCVLQSKEVQDKIEKTMLKKYGVKHPSQSSKIKEKIKRKVYEKHGVHYVLQTQNIRKKTSNRYIINTNEHLADWYKKQPQPKPAYVSLIQNFKNESVDLKEIKKYFSSYKENKTTLETLGEQLFNTKHFNKKPNEKINKKPDFKISEKVYVNVDGLYWHSNAVINNNKHHFDLYQEFNKQDLTIFQFRENEIKNNPVLCKNIVDCFLLKTKEKNVKIFIEKNINKHKLKNFLNHFNLKNQHNLINPNEIILFAELKTKNVLGVMQINENENCFIIQNVCIRPEYNITQFIDCFLENNKTKNKDLIIKLDLRYQHKEKKDLLAKYKIKENNCPIYLNFLFTDGKKIICNEKKYKIYDAGHIVIKIVI